MAIYVCEVCKGQEVFHDSFVNVNDHSDIRIFDDIYCMDCNKSVSLVKKENSYLQSILDRD